MSNQSFCKAVSLFVLAVVVLQQFAGCTSYRTYQEKIAPIPMPAQRTDSVNIDGAWITADPYADSDAARAAFGFDIRGAGLLPVRFAVDNQSRATLRILPQQTFLIDRLGQAWPLLSADQAYQRVRRSVDLGETAASAGRSALILGAAGAIAGFAIGVLVGNDIADSLAKGAAVGAGVGALYGGSRGVEGVEDKIRLDLAHKTLRNQRINPGELAHGYLFFPGRDEAASAVTLRMAFELDGSARIANVPLKPLEKRALKNVQ